MTDQTIPADEVREIVEKMYHHANHDNVRGGEEEYVRFFARQFDELLPAPPLPTLADMTEEERRECQWMQADLDPVGRAVIVNPHWEDGSARVMWPGGFIEQTDWGKVTPRPDLPRMEWPSDKKPNPAPVLPGDWRLADHEDYGRVIVTNPTPDIDGHVCFVLPASDSLGYDWHLCFPGELTYIDTAQEADQ